jgi:AcrR family transcriptional regulator
MPRRSAEDAALTRKAILEAAHDVFAARGYADSTVDEIASLAGVTRGAVYHHFAGKPALFHTVFVELTNELDAAVRAAASRHTEIRSAFIAGCLAWLDFATRPDYRQIAIADAPAVIGVAEWHRVDTSVGLASMELGLSALADETPLAIAPTRALAVLLFGALTEAGLAIERGDAVSRDDVVGAWTSLIGCIAPSADRPSRSPTPHR